MNIAVIIGSLRRESFNKQLAELASASLDESVVFTWADIGGLPLFNQDNERPLPEAVASFKQTLRQADGVLLVTPEYNRSIPGPMKNAIDWASRPDDDSVWTGKPVGIMGASTGQFGTITAQFDMRRSLTHAGAMIMPQPQVLVTKADRKIVDGQFDAATVKVVQRYMTALVDWINRFAMVD